MVMRRRVIVAILAGALAPLVCFAQHPASKIRQIGVLHPQSPAESARWKEIFLQGLSDLGWAEGRNLRIEYRHANGNNDLLPALAAELVSLKVEAIVAGTTAAVRAVKQATGTIPIVMAVAADPVATGLVASLAWPGGNVTGLTGEHPELAGKRLELLKELAPKAFRLASCGARSFQTSNTPICRQPPDPWAFRFNPSRCEMTVNCLVRSKSSPRRNSRG